MLDSKSVSDTIPVNDIQTDDVEFSHEAKIGKTKLNQIKEYLKNNNIGYYDWNINSSESNNEIIENVINQIVKNEDQEIIIQFNNSETNQSNKQSISTIIELLKQMNYSFDTVSNYKKN